MDTVFVAATWEELGPLAGFALGVGPVAAAVTAGVQLGALADDPPDLVVLVGTCGAYPGGIAVGDVIVARRVGLGQGVAEVGAGYAPRAPEPLVLDPTMAARVRGTPADVLTTTAITTDPELVAARGAHWQVEHMEAYAVVAAAERLGIRCAVVLGVANIVGPGAHAAWKVNRGAAEEAAREAARQAFAG